MTNADGGAGGSVGAGGDRRARLGTRARIPLRVIGAGLLAATTAIHLDLYQTGYRTIPTIGPLFLFQIVVGFLLAALVLLTGSRLAAAAAALFALATLGGYLLSLQFGLFGFREVRTTAGIVAGILDVLAFAVLAVLAVSRSSSLGRLVSSGFSSSLRSARTSFRLLRVARRARKAARHGGGAQGGLAALESLRALGTDAGQRPAAPGRKRSGAGISPAQAAASAAAISLAALGLLAAALAFNGSSGGSAPAGPGGPRGPQAGLRTTMIGGKRVLSDSSGMTLYWFAPDTRTKSVCYGTCATYWPPVPGMAAAPAGIPGRFGTISRHGGGKQETYNGHPLYTYVADTAPGQARGSNLNLNGGYWYEMVVSGR